MRRTKGPAARIEPPRSGERVAAARPGSLSFEGLQSDIESFAPKSDDYPRERGKLWSKVRDAIRRTSTEDPDSDPDTVLRFVLAAVVTGYNLYVSRSALQAMAAEAATEAEDLKWYRRERRRLENLLDEIADHNLVRSVRLDAVEFYDFSEVRCAHGRWRKVCQGIFDNLTTLREETTVTAGIRAGLERALKRAGVDHTKAQPEDFCAPTGQASGRRPALVPQSPRGKPRSELLQDHLLLTVGRRLTRAGIRLAKACAWVQDILEFCFRETVGADTLKRRWQRLHRPARSRSRPKSSPPLTSERT
jgi:hypothetical protein